MAKPWDRMVYKKLPERRSNCYNATALQALPSPLFYTGAHSKGGQIWKEGGRRRGTNHGGGGGQERGKAAAPQEDRARSPSRPSEDS